MTASFSYKLIIYASLGFLLSSLLSSSLTLPRIGSVGHSLALWARFQFWGEIYSTDEAQPPDGLRLLYSGEDPVVDIVVVHGLNGHRERTWTASNGVMWPRDLLPTDLPNSRIYSWGYDARVLATSKISKENLHGRGMALVEELGMTRKETNTARRPIIFIAHSLGGLVVKSALIHCDSTKPGHFEEDRAILLSTRSVYFMGTPHRGANGVGLGQMLTNIGAVAFNKNSALLQHLGYHSERLDLLSQQFSPLEGEFEIKYFYETKETELPGGVSMLIVPKDSAAITTKNSRVIGIEDGHRNMVRFHSQNSSGYRKVARHLKESTSDAAASVQQAWTNYDHLRGRPSKSITGSI